MSIYKSSSLAMIPTAYKDGKLYSVRPTDGSGDFTFSRGSNLAATRVDVNGLIEKGRENDVLYSNAFTGSTWVQSNITQTTGFSDPFGGNGASKFLETTANDQHRCFSSFQAKSYSIYTQSVYVKPFGRTQMLYGAESNSLNFVYDFTTESIISTFGNMVDYGVTNVGSGWYRFSLTFVVGSNFNHSFVQGYSGGSTIYVGDVTKGFYAYGAQLEAGLVATDYIETGASTAQAGILEDMPRLDYSGGASCPSLLLEPQRSNLITHSEYFGGYFNVTEINLSYNYAISPDGTLNANKVTFPSTSNSMYKSGLSYSGTHSISFWYKGEGSNVGKTFDVRLQGTSANQNIDVTLESGWKRFEAQSDGLQILEITNRSATTIGAGSLLLYGFQIEAGSYPTSYIPTYGSSVTRSEDVCGATGLSSVIGQTQGVIFMDFIWSNSSPTGGDYALMVYGANTADFVSLNANGNTNQMLVYAGGSAVAAIGGGSFVVGQRYKIALVYSENYFAYYINGVLKGTDTSGAVPNNLQSVRTETPFGLKTSSQKTQQLVFFPTALTDSECIALTTI